MTSASRPEGAKGELLERAWGLYGINAREHFALCRKNKDDLDLTCAACYRVHAAVALCVEYAREQMQALYKRENQIIDESTDLRAQLQTLRGERDAHEKCIEEIQADALKVAERENELHAEKDAQIARLTQEKAALEARPVRVFNDNRDDLCAYILELEARERALVEALRFYVDWYAGEGMHERDDCPEDDTCACPKIAKIAAALAPRPRQ